MSVVAGVREQQFGIEIERHLETHARSTVVFQELGHVASTGALETEQGQGLLHESWNDFVTALEENLATDPEYGNKLKFDPMRERQIVNGQVVDSRGRRLNDIVMEGYWASKRAAEEDPEMEIQVERDQGDIQVVQIVDTLEVGQMYAVVSLDPKAALKRNRDYWLNKNYREGMAVAQVYYKKDEHTLLAGAYSIKESDTDVLREIFAEHGVEIPEDISDNYWTRYGIRKNIDLIGAQSFGHQLQEDHRQRINNIHKVISVTELIAANREIVERYFEYYIKPLSTARYTHQNNGVMQGLARSLLTGNKNLDPEDRKQLLHIANSSRFSITDTSFMEEKIRYALVEELRQKVPALLTEKAKTQAVELKQHQINYNSPTNNITPAVYAEMNSRIAANVARGEAAGRTYGGCSGAGKIRKFTDSDKEDIDPSDPQNVFGGRDSGETKETEQGDVECDYKGTFCYCCPYNSDGTAAKKPYEITARRDKSGVAHCLRAGCGATLDGKGNARKGAIYAKAMILQETGLDD